MPLFKVGDIIESGYSNRQQHKVISIDPVYYTLESLQSGANWGETITFVDNFYVLSKQLNQAPWANQGASAPIPSSALPLRTFGLQSSQYKLGDKVITKWNNELEVAVVDIIHQVYYYRILKSNNPMKVGTADKETFDNAHQSWKLKPIELKPEVKVCTCDSRVLFNKGCQCNAIKPYRSRFG